MWITHFIELFQGVLGWFVQTCTTYGTITISKFRFIGLTFANNF